MSKKEKLLKRLCSYPKDFSFEEVETLLGYFDYRCDNKGRTSGSRIAFLSDVHAPILLHKPHDGSALRSYQIKQLINQLKQEGLV